MYVLLFLLHNTGTFCSFPPVIAVGKGGWLLKKIYTCQKVFSFLYFVRMV